MRNCSTCISSIGVLSGRSGKPKTTQLHAVLTNRRSEAGVAHFALVIAGLDFLALTSALQGYELRAKLKSALLRLRSLCYASFVHEPQPFRKKHGSVTTSAPDIEAPWQPRKNRLLRLPHSAHRVPLQGASRVCCRRIRVLVGACTAARNTGKAGAKHAQSRTSPTTSER